MGYLSFACGLGAVLAATVSVVLIGRRLGFPIVSAALLAPPEARLKASDSTDPSQLSWYTTPEGSRIAQINTQGDQASGEIVAWVIIGGADGFVINPRQFYFINGSLTDHGVVQPPDPAYHLVGTGVEYTFSIDYSHLPALPAAAVEGYVYEPGTPAAIWG